MAENDLLADSGVHHPPGYGHGPNLFDLKITLLDIAMTTYRSLFVLFKFIMLTKPTFRNFDILQYIQDKTYFLT